MKILLTFIRKEFIHIVRDPRTLLILIGMPIVQILLFGFAITTELRNVSITICQTDVNSTTEKLIEKFEQSTYFSINSRVSTPQEAYHSLENGQAKMAILFDNNFASHINSRKNTSIQLLADATDPNTAATAVNYASAIIRDFSQNINATNNTTPASIAVNSTMLYNPQGEGAYNFVPGVMGLILMLICAMMTSIAIVREKEKGSMELLFTSPLRPLLITISKAIPYFVLSLVNLTTILLISHFVLHVPIQGSIATILAASFLYIFVALLVGLLISNKVSTQVAAMLISGMGMMIPTITLSGMMFPIENMPIPLQTISHVIPARWYISLVRKVMIQGVETSYVAKEFAMLGAMMIVLLVANIKSFKKRLE